MQTSDAQLTEAATPSAAPGPRRRVWALVVLVPAALGAAAGLLLAGLEIRAQEYLGQGLWHTALWLASEYSLKGALAGAGAGLYSALWLFRRNRRDPAGAPSLEHSLGLVLTLSLLLALALSFLPPDPPELLEVPSRFVAGGAAVLWWMVMTAVLLSRREDPGSDAAEGSWVTLVWLGYLLGLAHLWDRLPPGVTMAGLACGGLLAATLAYACLDRPMRRLFRALYGRLRRPTSLRLLQRAATTLPLLVALLWLSGNALSRHLQGGLKPTHPNVLIIAVDTLRSDHLTLSRPTSGWDVTPNVRERLSSRATHFRRAYSQAPWTLPSFSSLFTGLYAEQHGAMHGASRLAPDRMTLAEVLREAGYRTMAVTSVRFLTSYVGTLQGFESRDESQVRGAEAVTSAQVTDRALRYLSARHDDAFFLFVHYFDPHDIYTPHPEFRFARRLQGRAYSPVPSPEFGLTESDVAQIRALYAEEVAYTDHHIGRLLAYLDEHHLWDSTLVIFVADHGEEFRDHGGFGHGQTLFDELIHVPLLVADPARPDPKVVDDVVETRWLFGSVPEMLGLRPPSSAPTTPSLFAPPPGTKAYARSSIGPGKACLVEQQYKVIEGSLLPRRRVPVAADAPPTGEWRRRPVLFDLVRDPHETQDLSQTRPDVLRRLSSALEALDTNLQAKTGAESGPRQNRDHLRKLRDLGYL